MSDNLLTSPSDQALLDRTSELARRGVSGVPELLQLFQQRSWTVRRAVVAALAGGDPRALEAMTQELVRSRAHEPTIAGIVDALSLASPAVEPLVRKLLLAASSAVLCDAIQITGRRRDRAAVSRLVELTEHVDDNVVLAAVEALGRIGGADAVGRLLELARGNNFFRAFPAIEALGAAREASAVAVLRELLKNPLYGVEAARALGRIGTGSAAEALVGSLETANDALLRAAAAALISIQNAMELGMSSASAVSRAVRAHGGPALRAKVTRALAMAEGDDAVTLGRLLIWLADEESVSDFLPLLGGSDEMSALAIDGLRKLGALDDPRVIAQLAEGSSELRAKVLPALTGISAANSAIAACLADPQASVRALACHALSRGHATHVVPRLFELLGDPDLGVAHAAIGAIQSLGSGETEALALDAARSSDLTKRRAGLRVVLYFGYPGSLSIALEAIESSDERLREIALNGLPALDDPRVTEVLIGAASHASPRTRASAARALSHVAPAPEVERVLSGLLGDADAWVRYYACQSLGRLRAAGALAAISALLDDPTGQVKVAAVEALSWLPGEQAARALSLAASSSDVDVQRAALVGIGNRRDTSLKRVLDDALVDGDDAQRLVALSSIALFPESEGQLERVARDDSHAGVRSAAIELLAARDDAPATSALVRLLRKDNTWTEVRSALSQNLDRRLPTLLGLLGDADEPLAGAIAGLFWRGGTRGSRAALDLAFASENPAARRATARVLAAVWDDGAKASLARAATLDTDPQVRQICSAAIA